MDERLKFIEEDLTLTHVISEPGDMTKYDFHYYQYFLGVSLFFYLFIFLLNPKRDFNI